MNKWKENRFSNGVLCKLLNWLVGKVIRINRLPQKVHLFSTMSNYNAFFVLFNFPRGPINCLIYLHKVCSASDEKEM
ncbi:BTB/POZ domain-containing protein [Trichinella spiralis]|uniref:BTB/POZ domain-containing protein n=1 Tax=Trichinella spiralis TaxID=6334 RepID=A0ABR3KVY3_TRISP